MVLRCMDNVKGLAAGKNLAVIFQVSFAVMLGGALGALVRVLIAVWIHGDAMSLVSLQSTGYFPFATLMVNIVGSFGLGYVVARFLRLQTGETKPSELMFLTLGTGFFGALTTFSAFVYEIKNLLVAPLPELAWAASGLVAVALTAHLLGGALVAALGYRVGSGSTRAAK